MPRGVTVFNGSNDEINPSVVEDKIEGEAEDSKDKRDFSPLLPKVAAEEDSLGSNRDHETRLAMAVEFDHMYIGCSETKASIGQDIEVQHLKDFLLLHLDLIQQQAEQLVAKDKLIKRLTDENENLKSKLDRIDRRVSLSLGKKVVSETILVEPKTELVSEDVINEHSPRRLSSPTSKTEFHAFQNASCSKSPTNRTISSGNKSVSPASKSGSPSSKSGSPSSKIGSLSSKPGSPSSKPVSPLSKPGSPSSKPVSPLSKPGSPISKSRSPSSRPGPSANKSGSPVSRSSPSANKSPSLSVKVTPPNNTLSPSSKFNSSSKNDLLSNKPLSPQAKATSPSSKAASPSSKMGLLMTASPSPPNLKPSSPQPKTAVYHDNEEKLPVIHEDSVGSIEAIYKSLPASKTLKKVSPKQSSPKTPLRESRQRHISQSQNAELDTDSIAKDLPKSSSVSERERIKRKSESESDSSTPKRIRTDRESRSSHSKDEGLTDHNLRSRDKSKDRVKDDGKSDELPPSPVEFPASPSPRAAALEAKKLRQKLQLKEECVQREKLVQGRGKPPVGASVRAEGILNTTVSYHLPYGALRIDPNPEEACPQSQVETPRWGTRILTSLYVMEGTENLEDEIFIKRHAKLEQDEKRRKRWDLQRMREQRHYERLRERYESRQTSIEPTSFSDGSLWPHPESALYLHVEDTLPVCAFGQPLARIPPQEFAIPWLNGQCFEGVSTRRKKR